MFIKLLSAIKKLYQEPVLQHCLCSLFDCLTSITYLEMKIKVNVMILPIQRASDRLQADLKAW